MTMLLAQSSKCCLETVEGKNENPGFYADFYSTAVREINT